ncbi:MAG TPA: hypothetical protein PKH77_26560 [Anaerolineae bacterium]|nr:hypothetical protein [Anaerolineae bacterium]
MTETQTTPRRRIWPWLVAIGCGALACVTLMILAAALLVGGGLAYFGLQEWAELEDWDPTTAPWEEIAISLPDDGGQVIFLRQQAYPMLMDYNQKLRLELTGQTPLVVEMPTNIGGNRTFTNVYWVAEGIGGHATLQLIDCWGMYVVDIEAPPTTALWVTHLEGEWQLNGAPEDTPALLESLADHQYLGCLSEREWPLRFIPASEAPETEIDFVGD